LSHDDNNLKDDDHEAFRWRFDRKETSKYFFDGAGKEENLRYFWTPVTISMGSQWNPQKVRRQ